MIEAFLDFFQLYTVDADYLPDFWLTMILLYLNAGLYLNDLYNLSLIHISAPEMNRLFADLVERSSRYREKR